MEPMARTPLTVALVNDYDIVVMGLAHILEQYQDRVVTAELDTNQSVSDEVDVVMYGSFAQPESDHDEISVLVRNPRPASCGLHLELRSRPERERPQTGVHGYLSKALPARDLVAALEAIHAG
jgi:DNA-binding NarL/FixJ family response regulator